MNYPSRPAISLSTVRLLVRQFTSPAILILVITALIYGLLGNKHDALVLLAIIIPSGLLTFVQEYRAEATLRRLASRLISKVTLVMESGERETSAAEVAVGDVVRLKTGDVIAADMIITSDTNLLVDESVLTGESMPRRKSPAGDRELFMGTHVSSGSALARVVNVGETTRFGAMVAKITSGDVETSFERGVQDFGLLVARAILVLVALVFGGSLILQRPLFESLLFSLALAVGLTPQMLPVIISVCLSAGARHLARERVLIKRLDAIEDLGTMEILCVDKTGTLTIGDLRVARAIDGFGNENSEVLEFAYVNAALQESSENAIDQAILSALIDYELPERSSEIGFTFERRRVSVVTEGETLICKGAVREVVAVCSKVRRLGEVLPIADHLEEIERVHGESVRNGYKVLAVATREQAKELLSESELVLEGFILISDPPKPDAERSLAQLRALGIDLYILTGDSLPVAKQIANEVGIETKALISGEEFAEKSDADIASCRIFAEFDPLQKAALIDRLRGQGRVVGFLGDGMNDVAALRRADVAISVDDALDIAKSASAIVLLEKELSVITDGVRIGRRTFENTMKYVRITISASFGNVLSMALASFFLPFLPMLPTQILLLNLFSDLPALAISSDRVDDEDLGSSRHWTMRGIGHFMVLFGVISTIFDLMLFLLAISILDSSATELRSAWFATSLLTEVIAIAVLRTRRPSWQSAPSRTLVAIALLVSLVAFAVPVLGIFAGVALPRIDSRHLISIVAVAAGYWGATEIAKARSKLLR